MTIRALVLSLCGAFACSFATPASDGVTAAVRIHVFRFVDGSRTIHVPGRGRIPRPVATVVRYPASPGPHPLVVFGHGFALTPGTYGRLLAAWAQAGYVVAAPVFPLAQAGAPGGPNEADIVNQPRDVSFVITRLLAEDGRRQSLLAGRIDPSRIAVAGHSDGGVTALAVAYDRRFRDARIRAAIVMSGAALPGMGPFSPRGPPLLAVQGTADPINSPSTTAAYYRVARRPKFLLWLLGASHLRPYTDRGPQLAIVEQATVAFLDHYLRGRALAVFESAARRPGVTRLVADP